MFLQTKHLPKKIFPFVALIEIMNKEKIRLYKSALKDKLTPSQRYEIQTLAVYS